MTQDTFPKRIALATDLSHRCDRALDRALMVHRDHTGAVMDLSFSPSGREFVTGSYDRTVRIFSAREGKSREVYHGRRMQRIFCAKFSADARFVLSGSDDGALHIWDAVSGRPIRTLEGHQGASYRAVWHARQGLLVSCGDDGTVRTWNYRSVLGGALD